VKLFYPDLEYVSVGGIKHSPIIFWERNLPHFCIYGWTVFIEDGPLSGRNIWQQTLYL
jgi:hypothetical protein